MEEDEQEVWSIEEKEKLLQFVTKVFLMNFPSYIAYKHAVHSSLEVSKSYIWKSDLILILILHRSKCVELPFSAIFPLTLCMLGNFFKYLFLQNFQKIHCFRPIFLLKYNLNVKQFGSQMKPHILWGFIWIQIVCIGHQQSSKFTASGLRVDQFDITCITLYPVF